MMELEATIKKRKRKNGKRGGGWIVQSRRLAIYARDGWECLICGLNLRGCDPRAITLDHIRPRINGGGNDSRNLYTCCQSCNSKRQDRPLAGFASPDAIKRVKRNIRRKLKGVSCRL